MNHTPMRSGIPADEIERLLDDTQAALSAAQRDGLPSAHPAPSLQSYQLEDLQGVPAAEPLHGMDLLGDVELDLRIELGRTQMKLEDVLKLRQGSVVALDKLAGDPVDIYVNGRLIARGEVLVMNDNFCVRVTELIGSAV